jgi:hypothetical protein
MHLLDLSMVKLIHIVYPKAIRIPDAEGLLPIHKAVQHSNLEVIKVTGTLNLSRLLFL